MKQVQKLNGQCCMFLFIFKYKLLQCFIYINNQAQIEIIMKPWARLLLIEMDTRTVKCQASEVGVKGSLYLFSEAKSKIVLS